MTGYVMALAPCYACGQPFTFNPHRVPSITVDGDRKAICRACVERANPERVANGLEAIVPLPGAYDALEEGQL